jgi:aspartyl-tRNA(Asn)/glutamyl-tRNA(Gln) amidotransferase subunit C
MALSLDDVKRLALLARIAISDEEARQVRAQLSGVFALIEQMQAVDTDGIEPMSHARDIALRLRPDEVTASDQHELFQSLAPRVEAGLYLVPKVIE